MSDINIVHSINFIKRETRCKLKIIGIYKITNNINGKSYIGKSTNILKRLKDHKNVIRHCNSSISNAISKYGYDNFSFNIIKTCDVSELDQNEIFFINELNTLYPNGYNLKSGGSLGHTYSSVVLKNMSKAKVGKKVSEETRRKQSVTRKKRWLDIGFRNFMINSFLGRVRSDECKKKISLAKTGKPRPKQMCLSMARNRMSGKRILCSNGLIYLSIKEAVLDTGLNRNSIARICAGAQVQSRGYTFKYI